MRLIKPSYEFVNAPPREFVYSIIEFSGRTAYQSVKPEEGGTREKFIEGIIKKGHLSVIEHVSVTVRVICDRGVTHELVRHRLASYTQESTRYCNYSKDRFEGHITFIIPCFFVNVKPGEFAYSSPVTSPHYIGGAERLWFQSMMEAEHAYFRMLEEGRSPQEARSVLPNSLKTTIVITMNLREWKHFFSLRTAPDAHPQMREIVIPIFEDFKKLYPIIFD